MVNEEENKRCPSPPQDYSQAFKKMVVAEYERGADAFLILKPVNLF